MKLLLIILLLLPFHVFACDCNPPPVALDFLRSEYVFLGRVIEKKVAEDSLTYTVTFRIDRHYKANERDPKLLDFTLPLESPYSTCGFNVNKNENWLVYAYKRQNGLSFYSYCTNSKPYRALEDIDKQELSLLERGDEIDINEIVFQRSFIESAYADFKATVPITPLNSLLHQIKPKVYKNLDKAHLERAIIDIDKDGNITNIVIPEKPLKYESEKKYDIHYLKYIPAATPTRLQKEIVKVLKQGKPWIPAGFNGRNVNSRVYARITFDTDGRLIVSELY